ncbi:MarR family winged helix-turn-helix transcriptional regulator [Kitasatospora sp. NPDC002040]|uniref:MarR family winged helix-turn-helix transcriptional regulator n=1 Tax=Kitasatospora sp. NPDC002040 TaxID=3154661 RepID=UPI00331D401B
MYNRRSGSSATSEQTVHLLAAAGRAVDAMMAERLEQHGVGPVHQAVLEALAALGPHARSDLAAQVELPEAEALRVVDELLVLGLVQAMVVNIGGRHEVVALTPAGEDALAEAQAVQDDVLPVQELLLASLTRGERTQLHYLLRRVCAAATRSGWIPPAP